jgi:hypothetical protein
MQQLISSNPHCKCSLERELKGKFKIFNAKSRSLEDPWSVTLDAYA